MVVTTPEETPWRCSAWLDGTTQCWFPGAPTSPCPPLLPPARDGDTSSEVMQLDFEMENFTSQSVTRRIMWHIDYRGRNPPPDLEKVVTELTVIQRDIRAIVPLAMVSGV